MTKRVFILAHPEARRRAAAHCMEAPDGHRVTFEEPDDPKSREQEKKYHAMMGDIAEQCELVGRKRTEEDAKRLLISAFKEDTKRDPVFAPYWAAMGQLDMTIGLRGEIVVLGAQSRKFKKPLASAFIEWLYALAEELGGVRWSDPKTKAEERARAIAAGRVNRGTGELEEHA